MNRFLLLLTYLLFTLSLTAQSTWSLGVESFIGISGEDRLEGRLGNLSSTVVFSDEWQEGFFMSRGVGLSASYLANQVWEFRAKVNFQQLGATAQLFREELDIESLQRTNQRTDFLFSQQQWTPALSARYYLLGGDHKLRPFVAVGGQATGMISFKLSSTVSQEQQYQNSPEILVQEEVYREEETQRSNAWRIGWFTALGIQWQRWSVHLRYDWESLPLIQLFPSDRMGSLSDCYACQFAERATRPQLQQASLRFGYRLF